MDKIFQWIGVFCVVLVGGFIFKTWNEGRSNFPNSGSQFYSRSQFVSLLNNHHMFCANFDKVNKCEVATYPATITNDYYTYHSIMIIDGPRPQTFIKILVPGRATITRNGICETSRVSDIDNFSFYLSTGNLAHIEENDILIPRNAGAAELADNLKRILSNEFDGIEECIFLEPHERIGNTVNSFRVVTFKNRNELKNREFIMYMFDEANSKQVRLATF